jgi:hypothetical protein
MTTETVTVDDKAPTGPGECEILEKRVERLEAAVRQLYELEQRFKPARFEKQPMLELQSIVENRGSS